MPFKAEKGDKMQNILLGKTIKAMYKLSGKTIIQLADETGLTTDTLNNLFYARLQKPGFFGVESVVEACGYTIPELLGFIKVAETLPEDADITDEFTKYIFSANDTVAVVNPAVSCGKSADSSGNCCTQIQALNEEHEKQLDRFRATHLHYVGELHARYQEQIKQMESSAQQLKEHYDHSVGEIKKSHEREIEGYKGEIRRAQNVNRWLTIALIAVAIVGGVIAFVLKG